MDTSPSLLERLAAAPSDDDWRRLADLYAPLLRAWLARAGVPPADRDDLLQDVLMAVVRDVGRFDRRGPGAFRAWLRGILANRVRDHARRWAARPPAGGLDPDALADPASDPSRQWDREHDEWVAARALARVRAEVTPPTWAAFARQVLDGRPARDAAAELGVSVNAVLVAKSRVLKRVRAEVAGLVG